MKQVLLTLDAGSEADIEDLEAMTRQLRAELLEIDVESVSLVREGETPEQAKVGDPITWGALILTFISGGGLAAFIGLLKSWLNRYQQSSVTIKIGDDELTITGQPTEIQQQVINAWLYRHQNLEIVDE